VSRRRPVDGILPARLQGAANRPVHSDDAEGDADRELVEFVGRCADLLTD
jgi:hypothetical protein